MSAGKDQAAASSTRRQRGSSPTLEPPRLPLERGRREAPQPFGLEPKHGANPAAATPDINCSRQTGTPSPMHPMDKIRDLKEINFLQGLSDSFKR